jgi:Holliday junction resolvasome RuvABC endonuclease subunit
VSKETKVLSLDQSTRITGWCLMSNGIYNSSGIIEVKDLDDTIERISLMNTDIIKLIDGVKPDIVLFEDTQYQQNASAFRTLSQLQGVIMAYLFKLGLPFYIIPSTAWKSYCGIKGKRRIEQKKNTQIFVKEKYGLGVSEDESDAIGIATYGNKLFKTAYK